MDVKISFFALALYIAAIVTPIRGDDKDLFTKEKLRSNIDCLGLKTKAPKFLSWFFKPNSRDEVQTRFFITTRDAPNRKKIPSKPDINLQGLDFKPSRGTVVISHGFQSNADEDWVREMEQAFLKWRDVNVVTVDWRKGSNTWRYWKAAANAQVVGAELTRLLGYLVREAGLNTSNLHLVGHSLGSHIVSFAAENLRSRSLGTVGRITGLDPAHLCFAPTDNGSRLDQNDATFVDVIHSNGQALNLLGLGKPFPVGHVDFYPNGGMAQPGCVQQEGKWGFISKFINKIKKAICSHSRAYMFFTDSLKSNCTFWGHRWNIKSSIHPMLDVDCKLDDCTQMGIHAIDFPARGTFYVETSDASPYCVAEPKTEKAIYRQMKNL